MQRDATTVEDIAVEVQAKQVLDVQVVAIAFVPTSGGTWAWRTAAWETAPAVFDSKTQTYKRDAKTLYGGDLPRGSYTVKVKITASPEIPVVNAGLLELT